MTSEDRRPWWCHTDHVQEDEVGSEVDEVLGKLGLTSVKTWLETKGRDGGRTGAEQGVAFSEEILSGRLDLAGFPSSPR